MDHPLSKKLIYSILKFSNRNHKKSYFFKDKVLKAPVAMYLFLNFNKIYKWYNGKHFLKNLKIILSWYILDVNVAHKVCFLDWYPFNFASEILNRHSKFFILLFSIILHLNLIYFNNGCNFRMTNKLRLLKLAILLAVECLSNIY